MRSRPTPSSAIDPADENSSPSSTRLWWLTAPVVAALATVAVALITNGPSLAGLFTDASPTASPSAGPTADTPKVPEPSATSSPEAKADNHAGPGDRTEITGNDNHDGGVIIGGDGEVNTRINSRVEADARTHLTINNSNASLVAPEAFKTPAPAKAPACRGYPVTLSAPGSPAPPTFLVKVQVACAPREGYTYLFAVQIDDVGEHHTTNTHPKILSDSSYTYQSQVKNTTKRTYLVYAIPDTAAPDITSMIESDKYWYEGPPPFEIVANPIPVKPQP